ncbi:hypothetical protein [Thiorhodococcus minor]|uniref:Uncharacterized protein n=1 Tax=Thiorhodococcus minor TaxID=57489 RepID=A0A6M0JV42_9GAMM|nr:hypothetical protein [Thiorhodococcus minor]NEV60463.1 hypothetical protein [Thiorhodococcus minor]
MSRRMNAALLIGLIGTPIAGSMAGMDYGRAIWGDDQIWWTPRTQALPLEATEDSFRIYLENEPLSHHLKRSSLTALGRDGMAYFVTPDLFRARINNWDRVKAGYLHSAVYSAFGLGVTLTCLVLGLIQFFREPPQPRRRVAGARPRTVRR